MFRQGIFRGLLVVHLIGNSARYDGCSHAREGVGHVKSVPNSETVFT